MAEFAPPPIAPQLDGSGALPDAVRDAPPTTLAPITDQEVGEYREQDRFLPVCTHSARARASPSPLRVGC